MLVAVDTPEALLARCAAVPRVEVRTRPSLAEGDVKVLPGAVGCAYDGQAWRIETAAVNRTVTALAALVESRGAELLDMQIHRPTLDDVFVELTAAGEK